uniref:Toxin_TOLIP domain-containing protein n=1 Tax=Strongyloides papillosus TaxID=174720 RepID=A0A0N5B4G0_STREA
MTLKFIIINQLLLFSVYLSDVKGVSNSTDKICDVKNNDNNRSFSDVLTSGLECYYCTYSIQSSNKNLQLQKNHMDYCLSKNKLKEDLRLRTPCAIHENQCMSVIKLINNRIVDIERDCVNTCSQQCFETGYGITVKRCIRCCNTSFCNDFSIEEMDSIEIKLLKTRRRNYSFKILPIPRTIILFCSIYITFSIFHN